MKFAPNPFLTKIIALHALLTPGALAATKVFDGGANGDARSFSAGANWGDNTAPGTGDDLFVGGTVLNGTPAIALLGNGSYLGVNSTAAAYTLVLRSLTLDNSLDQFPGAGLRLQNSTTTTAQAGTLRFNTAGIDAFVVTGDANSAAPVVSVESRSTSAAMTVDLNYNGLANFRVDHGGTLTFDGTNTTSGLITGTGGINKVGNGTLSLIGNSNTFSGGLTISEGVVSASLAGRLGGATTLNPSAVVINGGTLRFTDTTATSSLANRGFQVGSSTGIIDIVESTKAVTINGVIGDVASQAGSLVKTGAGTLELTASNTFTGGFTISGGMVVVPNTLALGSTASNSSAVILNGGTLRIEGTGNATSVAGRGFRVGSATGTIDILNSTRNITIAGVIQDVAGQAGNLVKTGAGVLTLDNTNTFTGGLTINEGVLAVASADRLGSSAGVNMNGVIINGGTLRFTGTGDIISSANRGFRVGASTGTIEVVDAAKMVTINGTVRNVASETGNLVKTGAGTLALQGNNTYSGLTTVSEGTLLVNGSLAGALTVASTATVGGSGSINGSATINGTLSPGESPGTMSFEDLSLASTSTLLFEITGGTVPGASDLIEVNGTLDLGGATLNLSQLGEYLVGNKFTLFSYDGLLTGTFDGLGDGDEFNAAGGAWVIDYDDDTAGSNGGTGMSFVTITAVPETSAALFGSIGLLALVGRRRRI